MRISLSGLAILAIAGALVTAAALRAEELNLEITLDRTDIYVGDSVIMSVTINGTQSAPSPDLSALRDCAFTVMGPKVQYVMTFNGPSRRWISYPVRITPSREGEFVMGPVRVEVDGRVLTATGPTLRVQGAAEQAWVRVNVTASRDSVLVDETFDVLCTVAVRQLPPPYLGHDPLDPRDPPHLHLPYLDATPSGLQQPEVQPYLQQHVVQRQEQPGFLLNDLRFNVDPVMQFFNAGAMGERMAARFMFDRQTVTLSNGTYQIYHIPITYTARKEGAYTFGPVAFKGRPITDVGPGGQIGTRPVFTIAPAITVAVVPPPKEGRPESFIGAIGTNLVATATLDTQTCNVGDPLTLTIDIGGDVSFANMSAPVLSKQGPLRDTFRLYDDTVRAESREGGRTYRYTLRPIKAGTYELPPIAVSYFDSRARAYRTAYTEPIPIRANETAEVAGGMVLRAETNAPAFGISFSRTRDGTSPAPLTLDPAGALPEPFWSMRLHGATTAGGPLLLLLALGGRVLQRATRHHAKTARPRGALRQSVAALSRAARETDATRRANGLRAAIALYVGERLQAPAQGLTPADLRRLLQARTEIPASLAERVGALYESLFLSQYIQGAQPVLDPAAFEDVRQLLASLEGALRAGAAARPPAEDPQ